MGLWIGGGGEGGLASWYSVVMGLGLGFVGSDDQIVSWKVVIDMRHKPTEDLVLMYFMIDAICFGRGSTVGKVYRRSRSGVPHPSENYLHGSPR